MLRKYIDRAFCTLRALFFFGFPAVQKLQACGRKMSLHAVPGSKMDLGRHVRFGRECGVFVARGARLHVGDGTSFQDRLSLNCSSDVHIGKGCLVSWDVQILDTDFHQIIRDDGCTPPVTKPIFVDDRVWIGARVTILKGVRIGSDSVIAAGSVVTGGSFPPNSLIAGNPAKRIKSIRGWRP